MRTRCSCEGKKKMGAMERQPRHLHWLVAFVRSFVRSSRSIDHDRGDPRRAHRSGNHSGVFRVSYDTFAFSRLACTRVVAHATRVPDDALIIQQDWCDRRKAAVAMLDRLIERIEGMHDLRFARIDLRACFRCIATALHWILSRDEYSNIHTYVIKILDRIR